MKTTDVILFITNKANDTILLERIDDKNTDSPISRLPELHDIPDERSQIKDFIKDTMKKKHRYRRNSQYNQQQNDQKWIRHK